MAITLSVTNSVMSRPNSQHCRSIRCATKIGGLFHDDNQTSRTQSAASLTGLTEGAYSSKH
jgi:hypothetical protein